MKNLLLVSLLCISGIANAGVVIVPARPVIISRPAVVAPKVVQAPVKPVVSQEIKAPTPIMMPIIVPSSNSCNDERRKQKLC